MLYLFVVVVQHRESDALKFSELHRHIKTQVCMYYNLT